ncbi:MAG: hypothetical protein IH991_25420 [Planctomycetes bacterium]|nr:hypothetical protein [Planctomycetota bacterium]
MPVWHEATREWVKEGRLVVLGVTQEQHPDRCRLFAQWKKFDWPILHDPINIFQSQAVPIVVAIDEHGIVRSVRPRPQSFEREFLNMTFEDDRQRKVNPIVEKKDLALLERETGSKGDAQAWRNYADALVLWGGPSYVDDVIAAYAQAVKKNPREADSLFRLGVCYRMRHDSTNRRPGDFQAAVDYWGKALALSPNQYIWRRRIQQYGPRLDKPYPFYDWVERAVVEIESRSETPVALTVQPYGAEIARPTRQFAIERPKQTSPDPSGRINRDKTALIETEVAVVPDTSSAGHSYRIHITFVPNRKRKAHWNNEAEPLRLWVDGPQGWDISRQLLAAPQGKADESNEIRRLDFEIKAPSTATGKTKLNAYALYYVCEDVGGTCLFLRQDINIDVNVRGAQ